MKIDNKKAGIILSVIIILSLAISTFYMAAKQGFHEDELLTYNLANSSKQLNVDGGWNSPEDFNEYLAVSENDRFDYAQVYENQIIDASHPPFYYALVHTVCSLFPNVFSKWLAYSINVLAMVGILILLFKIGKKVTGNNLYALIASGAYVCYAYVLCACVFVYEACDVRKEKHRKAFRLPYAHAYRDSRHTHAILFYPVCRLNRACFPCFQNQGEKHKRPYKVHNRRSNRRSYCAVHLSLHHFKRTGRQQRLRFA